MSTNPSIIFHQGLRCTKVLRQPRATDSSGTTTETNPPSTTSEPSSTTDASTEDTTSQHTHHNQHTSSESTTSITTGVAITTTTSDPETESFLPSQTTSQKPGLHPSGLDSSVSHTTFATETPTTPQSTPSSEPIGFESDNEPAGHPPYAKIFGALFGVLGFIALVAIIILFFLRRRSRRKSAGAQDDRASANSRTGLRRDFRSQMSYLSGPSPTPSAILNPGNTQYAHNKQSQISSRYSNYSDPFSDTAEVHGGLNSAVVPIIIQDSPTIPNNSEGLARPAEPCATNRDSVHSGTSLGSTLVLPSRNSLGSDFPSSPSLPRSPGSGPATSQLRPIARTVNTRRGSFDLDSAQNTISRRSSGAMPSGLL
ncbi:hypothetical protein ASPVEDRAFT_27742 [Aspergillus versicolor CBS 583.65]|uniref:Mid2 domain-containing protein n=1 Tax=Aspergillus versicolor CBS 583.65 TaxID=1036611 RepID=A0A1L9PHX1_ASPVE|nr:uncharacterized protein ASPVEDRAFT_27742 [Aspergillus versicolor CBS 583.65]OJJ01045.1 hypothetical protein ASPVEDRAFT_27742 [Aspergillus versicolor CBS 583.65]